MINLEICLLAVLKCFKKAYVHKTVKNIQQRNATSKANK